jgi:hypothetical protein
MSTNTGCIEKQFGGNCSKGELCLECNKANESTTTDQLNSLNLNSNAKAYVPKSKKVELNSTNNLNNNISTNTSQSTTNTNININNTEKQLNFNLQAKEYVPKNFTVQNTNDFNDDYDNNDECEGEEFDMIMNDIIDNEINEELEEESDDEKWMPKYKDCECCKGYVYKCKGTACVNMGTCYCKMREECDDEEF